MIRPRLKVIKFHPLQGPPDSLPLISWQMVLIQSADSTRVIDPVLAAARGTNVYFHQVSNENHDLKKNLIPPNLIIHFRRFAFNRVKYRCYFCVT